MKLTFVGLVVLISTLMSCRQSAPMHPNLTMIEDRSGKTIKEKDFISITFTEKTEEGKELKGSSEYDNRPFLLVRRPSHFKDDFFEMLGYLSEGDSARFKVSIDSISGKMKTELPPDKKGKYLIYNIRVNKVIPWNAKAAMYYDSTVEAYSIKAFEIEKGREPQKIRNYMSKHKLSLQKSPSGFMYKIIKPGIGPKPAIGDSVVVNYTGETLTGKVYETTIPSVAKDNGIYKPQNPYKPYGTRITDASKTSIFQKALKMFSKGTKVMLLIPSKGAYGANEYKMLQPYTPVVCHLEIVDIIKSR